MLKKQAVLLAMMITVLCCTLNGFGEEETSAQVPEQSILERMEQQIESMGKKIRELENENEIRRELQVTDDEKRDTEAEILSAAGRNYTLLKKGLLGFEYSFKYAGFSYDSLTYSGSTTSSEQNSKHTLTNTFYLEYAVKDNLTLSANVPFIYKRGSQSNSPTTYISDFGDVSLGFLFQPVKSGGGLATMIVNGALNCPMGRSPYKIENVRDLSTGSGGYSLSAGISLSKPVDPVVIFGGMGYQYSFPITGLNYKTGAQGENGIYLQEVIPGDAYSFNMGFGYSLSYKASVTVGFQYGYSLQTEYDWVNQDDYKSDEAISGTFSIGMGWRMTPSRTLFTKLNIGLTDSDPDFSVSFRIPLEFKI